MGISASSLLDEPKSSFIRAEADARLREFAPFYRKQFSVARLSAVEEDLEPQRQKITQLLRHREAPEAGEVLYEEGVFYFDDSRKWRERYVVVRANYCLECHDGLETFVKGIPPRHKLLPTGGAVLTTEESYMAMVDKCFPGDNSVKEDFAPPLAAMPGPFPVYLRLPYRRDSYFCFRQQDKQDAFLAIVSDCIRHQNQDFLKKKTCEVQAFLKAVQLYRQEQGRYQAWDMLTGSDVRVMANAVMEQLLPTLEKDLLPRLKAKKTEKKRVWFATVEAAYVLVQEHLLEGLSALKDECRASARQQEVLIHSDLDQILESRRRLEEKVRDKVSEPAEKLCCEFVQPYLGSILEELMEPISSGFQEGRQLSERSMDRVCQDVMLLADNEHLKKALTNMARPNLLSCFLKIDSLQEKVQHLQQRFGFSSITGVIHSAQIDLQQLMQNAAYTFEQLLHKAVKDNPDNPGSAIEKAKHRVLKQYDYDSSTVRKRISREALISITLPFIKKNLVSPCRAELQDLEQFIDADHSNFIHVENVYENVLLQSLDKEVNKVVKEAASLKKYNLFTDSRDLLSQSSRSSLSSPSVSTPGSPAMVLASPANTSLEPQLTSPLAANGVSSRLQKDGEQIESEASTDATFIETAAPSVAEEVVQTVTPEAGAPVALPASVANQSEAQEVNVEAAPETAIQEEVTTVQTAAEPLMQSADAPKEAEITNVEAEITKTEAPEPSPGATDEPRPGLTDEPSPGATDEPSPGPTDEPSPGATDEPSPGATDEPSPGAKDEPSPGATDGPSPGATDEPSPGAKDEPSPGATDEPSPGAKDEPSPGATDEPSPGATDEPSPGAKDEPSPGATDEPSPGATDEPSPDATDEPSPGATGEPVETAASGAEERHCGSSDVQSEAPSGLTREDITQDMLRQEAEPVTVSDPNSLDVSVGSESAPSDVDSMEEVQTTQISEDEISTTSDILEDEGNVGKSPESSADPAEEKTQNDEPPPQVRTDAVSSSVSGGVAEEGASAEETAADTATTPQPSENAAAAEDTSCSPGARPSDCIKEIRDLVVEVIEVEELLQRYPSGIQKDEE